MKSRGTVSKRIRIKYRLTISGIPKVNLVFSVTGAVDPSEVDSLAISDNARGVDSAGASHVASCAGVGGAGAHWQLAGHSVPRCWHAAGEEPRAAAAICSHIGKIFLMGKCLYCENLLQMKEQLETYRLFRLGHLVILM